METYLLKFSACLLVFWLVYVLVLERQNMHHFKRFYLLGAFAVALIIPLLTITQYIEPVIQDFEFTSDYVPIDTPYIETPKDENTSVSLETVLWSIYGIGVFILSIRFVFNLINLYRKISRSERMYNRPFIYVLLKDYRIPHSFFRYIFLNKQKFENQDIPREVLLHEETHAKQLHSLDIIILELLQILFWFHPLVYILKHHVKLNHEFLADEAVLNNGSDTKTYQTILLQFSSNTQEHQLSSAINYSSIKKRFTVMKTQSSKTRIWLSSLLLLPICAILFYSFAEREYVQKDSIDIDSITKELKEAEKLNMIYIDGATDKLMQEYRNFISEYKRTKIIYGDTYERAVIIYGKIMSDAQRASVEKYPERLIPEINLSKTRPVKPSTSQFEDFKNKDKYAIWIDGKHVANSVLDNYSVDDFVHVIGSFVHKNARSKKFPQPNQYHLYTKAGFKYTYQNALLRKYDKLTQQYSDAITEYLKGAQNDNSELKILKAKADKIYNSFSREQKEKHNILPPPPISNQKNNKLWDKVEKTLDQEKPILWIMVNRKGQMLVDDELGTLESIEKKLEQLSKTKTSNGLVYIKFDPEAPKKLVTQLKDLVKKYDFKVATLDATKIPPPPPPPPAPNKSKGGPNYEETQNLYNPSFLEYIIEMGTEGATFYLDNKKISFEDAKRIAKDKNSVPIDMLTQRDKNGYYIVKLTSVKNKKLYARSIELQVLDNNAYLIDGIKATKKTFMDVFNKLHQDISKEQRQKIMNIHMSSKNAIDDKEVWFIYNQLQDYGFYRIVTPNQEIIASKGNTPFAIRNQIENQQNLPTKEEVDDYNVWAKKIHSQSKNLSGDATWHPPINEEDLIKYSAIYKRMSSQQKKQSVDYPFPSMEIDGTTEKNIIQSNHQKEATKKQIAEYNTWAKDINDKNKAAKANKNNEYAIIKLKELNYHKAIYDRMTNAQRKNAQQFPDAPPPIKPHPGYGKKEKGGPNFNSNYGYSNSELKNKYIKKYKKYEALRYSKPHFLKKSKTDKKLMSDLWVELRQMYIYDLSKTEKADLKLPITPFAPYVKIHMDGKIYYKVNSQLTDEEQKSSTIIPIKKTSNYVGLDLLDESDPIVIPIGTYELSKEPIEKEKGKRIVFISIRDNGEYAINLDETYKNFKTVSLTELEAMVSKLNKNEIKNTFVFAQNKDSKKFRSKPSASPEYQDDIEIWIIKNDIKNTVMEVRGEYKELPSYRLALDNRPSDKLKSQVTALAKIFRKYGIKNLTI